MTDEDFKKIGDELERFLTPVYEWQDRADRRFEKIDRIQQEHTDKIDALTVEIHDVHQELGAYKDMFTADLDKVKGHVGLPTSIDS